MVQHKARACTRHRCCRHLLARTRYRWMMKKPVTVSLPRRATRWLPMARVMIYFVQGGSARKWDFEIRVRAITRGAMSLDEEIGWTPQIRLSRCFTVYLLENTKVRTFLGAHYWRVQRKLAMCESRPISNENPYKLSPFHGHVYASSTWFR